MVEGKTFGQYRSNQCLSCYRSWSTVREYAGHMFREHDQKLIPNSIPKEFRPRGSAPTPAPPANGASADGAAGTVERKPSGGITAAKAATLVPDYRKDRMVKEKVVKDSDWPGVPEVRNAPKRRALSSAARPTAASTARAAPKARVTRKAPTTPREKTTAIKRVPSKAAPKGISAPKGKAAQPSKAPQRRPLGQKTLPKSVQEKCLPEPQAEVHPMEGGTSLPESESEYHPMEGRKILPKPPSEYISTKDENALPGPQAKSHLREGRKR